MEKIINNPGLQHLAENIFWNLGVEDLKICAQINQSCKIFLQNPIFCLRKFEHLSKENQKDWIKCIQSVNDSDKGVAIISYLQWNFKKNVVNFPCYTSPAIQDEFRKKILESCKQDSSDQEDQDTEFIKILAPLTNNPNPTDEKSGRTAMYWAACSRRTDIVKILVPFIDDPLAPDIFGDTPIHMAAIMGCTEIVKILAPLTDNPNAPNNYGKTPIYWAAHIGCTEIVKILVPLTENPNAPNKDEITPLHHAAYFGKTEILKILVPLAKNLNAPDISGSTPIYWAARMGHTKIVKILAPLTDNPNAPNNYGKTPIEHAKNARIRRILEAFKTSRKLKSGQQRSNSRFILS